MTWIITGWVNGWDLFFIGSKDEVERLYEELIEQHLKGEIYVEITYCGPY